MNDYRADYLNLQEVKSLNLIMVPGEFYNWYDGPILYLSTNFKHNLFLSVLIDSFHHSEEQSGWHEILQLPLIKEEYLEFCKKYLHKSDISSNAYVNLKFYDEARDFILGLSTPYVFIMRDPYYGAEMTEAWKYPKEEYVALLDEWESEAKRESALEVSEI